MKTGVDESATSEVPVIASDRPGQELRRILDSTDDLVLVIDPDLVSHGIPSPPASAQAASGIATWSPVPAPVQGGLRRYPTHPLLPPPASLVLPSPRCAFVDARASHSLARRRPPAPTAAEEFARCAALMLRSGWRHTTITGLAHDWDPTDFPTAAALLGEESDPGAWHPGTLATLVGPANRGLETHRTWATTQLRPLRVVVDGACLDGDVHTGTQELVLQVSIALKTTRPDAHVAIAVAEPHVASLRERVGRLGVDVVDRRGRLEADLLYRPYQMIRVEELDFVMRVGTRRLVSQLDMIGFSNPSYHPSAPLFHVARNLQRSLMQAADGVTFISEFGRDWARAECPDIAPSRLHVVGCGADPTPDRTTIAPLVDGRFVACVSATFWHKNRRHAVSVFERLVKDHGYEGSLVIVGPQPFYGSSSRSDADAVRALPPRLADHIVMLGQVDERQKWWLLDHADLVLYPSVVEGFGLVPFEAAAVGTPTLAPRSTALAELLGNTSATISSWRPEDWAARAHSWLHNPAAANGVVAEISQVAERQSWRGTAELTWQAIDATLAQPCASDYVSEGGTLARVDPRSTTSRATAEMRQFAARTLPAIRRRLTRRGEDR